MMERRPQRAFQVRVHARKGGEHCPALTKSAHTRFVHSRGEFGLCLKSHVLDNSRDLWVLIQLG